LFNRRKTVKIVPAIIVNLAKTEQLDNDETSMNKKYNSKEVLADYKLANLSRSVSIMGRREVLSGKAKFGIFGDGKEIVQIALAKPSAEDIFDEVYDIMREANPGKYVDFLA